MEFLKRFGLTFFKDSEIHKKLSNPFLTLNKNTRALNHMYPQLTKSSHHVIGQPFHVWVLGQYPTQLPQYFFTLAFSNFRLNSHEQNRGFLMRSERCQVHPVHRFAYDEMAAVQIIGHNSWTLLQCVGHSCKVALEHSQRQVPHWLRCMEQLRSR